MNERTRKLAILAGAGALLCVLGAVLGGETFHRAYLLGWLYWLGIALGALAITMLHNLSGGAWGLAIRGWLAPALLTLPLLALLFLPIALGARELYLWAGPEAETDHLLHLKHAYLNLPFFFGRGVLYFAVWLALALLVGMAPRDSARARRGSGPGLVLYGLTMSFAAVDWVMSLDPHWFSTIFALILMVGQVLSAFAFAILLVTLTGVAAREQLRDLGNLMLAFVMLWTYMQLSQFLIIWSGNLPEEVPWYLRRNNGNWHALTVGLFAMHFALPFFVLLSRDVKERARRLAVVAAWILVMRFVDLYWLIGPRLDGGPSLHFHWTHVAMPLGLGCIWLAAFGWRAPAWKSSAT
jgi:hypothetical protein